MLYLGTKILTGRTLVNDRTAQDRLVNINIFIIYLQKYPEMQKIFEKNWTDPESKLYFAYTYIKKYDRF